MFKHLVRTALVLTLAQVSVVHAETIGWQQPYFTYSPGAVDFEDIEWTPLEFAAFSAYGGYFANIRRPRFETPAPHLIFQDADFGIEDEVKINANVLAGPTFMPQIEGFQVFAMSSPLELEEEISQDASVPEPGLLALIGIGLLGASRSLRRRLAR